MPNLNRDGYGLRAQPMNRLDALHSSGLVGIKNSGIKVATGNSL